MLRIATWNIRGIMHGTHQLCTRLDSTDLFFVTEHWLSEQNASLMNTIHDDFDVYYKCSCTSTSQRGSGGIATFIRKGDWCRVSVINTSQSQNIIGVSLQIGSNTLYVIGTRLPSTNILDSVYFEQLDYVMELYDIYSQYSLTILTGDFNADIRQSAVQRMRSRCLQRVLNERTLYSVVPLDDITKYTFSNKCKM